MGGESQNGGNAWWKPVTWGKMLCLQAAGRGEGRQDFAVVSWSITET